MGFWDFLKRKTTRYAVVIALVGTLVAGCRKDLPPEESARISALGAQVEKGLREGNPDKQKIKEFVRAIAQAKRQYKIDIQVPENLEDIIYMLEDYYERYYIFVKEPIESIKRMGYFPYNAPAPQLIVDKLLRIEKLLGMRLEDEREDLRRNYEEILDLTDKTIEGRAILPLTGKKANLNEDLKEMLRQKRERFARELQKLAGNN